IIPKCDTLDYRTLWSRHESYLYRASAVKADSQFYPVYEWNGLYSFTPLALLFAKKKLLINSDFTTALAEPNNDVSRPNPLIDREIKRLGGPPSLSLRLKDGPTFVTSFAAALKADVRAAEKANPGKTNVLLCGGKDSLNLLLLDWLNPVIAYSAEPNFPLVEEFVRKNHLDIEVRILSDKRVESLEARQIAEGFCLVDLNNWKWTGHLHEIAGDYDHELIFWKGQVADLFLTDYWRSYTSSRNPFYRKSRKAYQKIARFAPFLDGPLRAHILSDLAQSIWERSGVLQGAHMGFLRSICDCLVLSAYHGQKVEALWTSLEFSRVTFHDVRGEIGRVLKGAEVWYPDENPSPRSEFSRDAWRKPEAFSEAVKALGIDVESTDYMPVR
ncbi:MAG: hypothetical protein AAGA50_16970, partial [Pseudomonadota bacterium]